MLWTGKFVAKKALVMKEMPPGDVYPVRVFEPMQYKFEVRASLKIIPAFKDMIDFVNEELDKNGATAKIDYTSIIALPEIKTDAPMTAGEIDFSIKFLKQVFEKSFSAVEVKLINKKHVEP